MGKHQGSEAEKLLLEAVKLQNDPQQSLETARRFSTQHPGIYELILRHNLMNGSEKELLSIGQEALSRIPSQYIIRSKVALLTAVYALCLNKQEEAEQCWLSAFESDTKPTHYLRLAIESEDFSQYQERAQTIYQDLYKQSGKGKRRFYQDGELKENQLEKRTYYALAFLDGKFLHVIEDGMNVKEGLGWSITFMKEGLALFLLYMYQGDDLPAGCRYICDKASQALLFTAEEYSKGLKQPVTADNSVLFWECLRLWRKKHCISKTEATWVIEKLEQWIKVRVEGIIEGNHRRFYDECAAYVAALGEVRESRGETSGKANFMEAYRSAYSRRTAFHQELRAFGMRDTRKKK